jgi:hypothetical protein
MTGGWQPWPADTTHDVEFAFDGDRAISVTGPVTRRRYRFTPGSRLLVAAVDAPSVSGVPGLRRTG